MALKRKAEDEGEVSDEAKRRQVDDLLKGSKPSTSFKSEASGSRQMQGQSAEEGLHSIDSDDEEEYEKSKKIEEMNEDDLEGVEDECAVEREGEIQITPFNMKNEREEGFVAADGSFVFNKKKEEIRDSWLDNVDWGKVKERTAAELKKREDDDEKEEEAEAQYNEMESYRQILPLLLPKESVAKALRRLGGGKKTTAQKLKEKKRIKDGKETPEERQNRENMEKLTGLADAILSRSGHMEIYEETYESIAFKLKQEEEKNPRTVIPEGVDDDDALDMFMDSAKTREEDKKTEAKEDEAPKPESSLNLEDQVTWEFKWMDDESGQVHGPHTSDEMLKWQESGFFDKGVFVRKVGSSSEFLDGKRIDFDLYV